MLKSLIVTYLVKNNILLSCQIILFVKNVFFCQLQKKIAGFAPANRKLAAFLHQRQNIADFF